MLSFRFSLALLLMGSCLSGTTLEQLSLDEMVQKATSIVRARVASASPMQRGNLIHTAYRLQVVEQLKGSAGSTLEVAVPGGRLGQFRQTIPGSPVLESGKEYVVFVWTGKSGTNHIIGLSQGLFEVQRAADGSMVLQRPATDARMLDKQGREVQSHAVSLPLRSLQAKLPGSAKQ